jgi:hypothetical protein
LLTSRVHPIVLAALAAGAPVGSAAADPVTLSGITFSDERGGFVIHSASGQGTYEEPFVISEEITDPDGAVLVIRGDIAHLGNRIGTLHQLGFAMTKIVTNSTGEAWSLFELELEETYGTPSDYYDGLSFGQAAQLRHPFMSDRFSVNENMNEPIDELRFRDGKVEPGERVTLTFVITDATPDPEFFLLQRPGRLISARPTRVVQR